MSEFKFACPVCGQHITADSTASGTQLECPTCFQKIIVPQAPESGDSKFILSASQVSKPRPTAAWESSGLAPVKRSAASRLSLAGIALLVLALAAGAAVLIYKKQTPPPKPLEDYSKAKTNLTAKAATNAVPRVRHPIPTNITWTLELTNAVIPETRAAGNLHGNGFRCGYAILTGGRLVLHQTKDWAPEARLTIPLVAQQGEELSGKTLEVGPDRPPPLPQVALWWKEEHQHRGTQQQFTNGYMMKLVFGQAANKRMPAKIYICLPDEARSFVAGTFEAHIQTPRPPGKGKAKAPK